MSLDKAIEHGKKRENHIKGLKRLTGRAGIMVVVIGVKKTDFTKG